MSIQQMLLGVGAVATKTYVDDIFSTFLYTGNSATRSINTGLDMSKGGITWIKARTHSLTGNIFSSDIVNGSGVYGKLETESNAALDSSNSGTATNLSGFTSTGFSLGQDTANGQTNLATYQGSAVDYASWSFRKAPGFFDVVTYTGNGSNQNISHSLGCVPGCIMVKRLDTTKDWCVYHRATGKSEHLELNNTDVTYTSTTRWNQTDPTASVFTVGDSSQTNTNAATYVAYVFAGGESTAATARSVDFDGSGDYLTTSTSSDYTIGTDDFTLECWCYQDARAWAWLFDGNGSGANQFDLYLKDNGVIYHRTDSTVRILTSQNVMPEKQWAHIALVRSSGTTRLYVNGTQQGADYSPSSTENLNFTALDIGRRGDDSNYLNGKVSNVRFVKGTAVYTSSFRPPTEPLTSVTNTKLLCCNNSSVTGTTTGTVTSSGDPTASTDSPFDDPAGFVFGESGSESVIKTGSYVGNGSTTGPEIFLGDGWEPQWLMIKCTSATGSWGIIDCMRGIVTGGSDKFSIANGDNVEYDFDVMELTPTGFKITASGSFLNTNNETFVYTAIRRPDGYVGKPPELGTGAFAMDVGNSSTTIPAIDSGFPVDFALLKGPTTAGYDWYTGSRLIGSNYLWTNSDAAEASSSNLVWDSNTGYYKNIPSSAQGWMWKRHAGFDVVCYKGNETSNHQIRHSLNKTPEMMWVRQREATNDGTWFVWHKGLNNGNPGTYFIRLNTDGAESDYNLFYGTPTSTHFSLYGYDGINGNNENHIAMLFASVDGISKVGYYSGSNSSQTISLGFAPRFVLIKARDSSQSRDWIVLDTTRGWASGNDKAIKLNTNAAQFDYDFADPTSTGFTLIGNVGFTNESGTDYIYYAHA
jgi:hypothetical protein